MRIWVIFLAAAAIAPVAAAGHDHDRFHVFALSGETLFRCHGYELDEPIRDPTNDYDLNDVWVTYHLGIGGACGRSAPPYHVAAGTGTPLSLVPEAPDPVALRAVSAGWMACDGNDANACSGELVPFCGGTTIHTWQVIKVVVLDVPNAACEPGAAGVPGVPRAVSGRILFESDH